MIRRVTDYLEATSAGYPDKIAFTDVNRELSFRTLREAAFHVAQVLIKEGLSKQPVAVFMDKCVFEPAAFFGVAYSGNFYTPIDHSMPAGRIEKIIGTLSPQAVITDRENWENAKQIFDCRIFVMEDLMEESVCEAEILRVASHVIDTDTLYVLFTSGSTGTPKGVIIPHRSVIDYIEWITEKFDLNENTIIGNQAALYFDLSIQDVYAPLKTGCTTHLVPSSFFSFPKKLMSYLYERNVNTIIWIPTALRLMANMKALKLDELPPLEKVLFCGEVMPNKQLNKWRAAYPDTVFVNLYGPTEACDACAWYIVDRPFADDEPLPIGWPCENTDILVLNEQDQPVTGDEIGELCIRGTSLASGYYNEPEKTKEAFVQNPLNRMYPEIIYKTGDLVKYNERGELEYVSRKDFQIKHLGYRIELGEIETAISSVHGVEMNCCLYDAKRSHILLIYTGAAKEPEILAQASGLLPEYMLPDVVIQISEMPVNQNGKIDRAGLKTEYIR